MDRPTGVTILAILEFLGAGLFILLGLLFLVGFSLLGGAAGQAGEGSGMAVLMGLGAVAGVVFLALALIPLAIGIGLWKLKNWARILVIVFSILGVLSNLAGAAIPLMTGDPVSAVSSVIGLGVNGLILWYMFQPHVREAFGAS
ncbi:MAG: hypothetical protein ACRD5I_04550 [Candidatus Acidiferrales bacterium]